MFSCGRWIASSFITAAILIGLFAPIPASWQTLLAITPRPHPSGTATFPLQTVLDDPQQGYSAKRPFQPGITKPAGENYTKMLVIPRTHAENVDWIDENFGPDANIDWKIYVVDQPDAPLHPPQNKGHEVMVYLSYIIDHYDDLSDVNIFMHSHRHAWHNNDLLGSDAVQVVSRLSSERVLREGYMNLRCHWDPGCPGWMNPGNIEEDVNKQEETMLAKSWSELFPLDAIPNVLAQPCCAQFAISRDRIRGLPLARYVAFREWLLKTNMSDYFSGRVFEYIWQFIFTGKNVVCSREHVCYCDGFGICFGGEKEYDVYNEKLKERTRMEEELQELEDLRNNGQQDFALPEERKYIELQENIESLRAWCEREKDNARARGDVAEYRAREVGRSWKDGDGF
ncbi:uncharacterized protein L3040_001001 [Drepanopeziza brunnea f. sp. 'multigermtubi']|nr:hypothetical protein L3040_001001 [Drepanopeziza brunnea f. sp. 'multigermtubi']